MKVRKSKFDPALLNRRSAGILMHITSLPSKFGSGDFGPGAYSFADFLQRSGQTYWQLLPLNPTEASTGYSPYSSNSAFAGNTLLISPERLVEKGWLEKNDLRKFVLPPEDRADFQSTKQNKEELFSKAFENYKRTPSAAERVLYQRFDAKERAWLEDYALFVVLKNRFAESPWYEWPKEFRNREPEALNSIRKQFKSEIEKIKWLQFVFDQQWNELKAYCNSKSIYLFGDLPFYVSFDSSDVWSSREIFSVNKKGEMELVAGVPPDYFNSDGQLWGMPVFRWEKLKQTNYSWWVRRIEKNIQLYDVLRLDHFRAFAGYWAVPSSEKTAKNGSWKKGPGNDLFDVLASHFGKLPFIAEDLGDIDDRVHALRLHYELPGMKVLQFAFGDNCSVSDYIPHQYEPNFAVYTGTHDNNTTKGWLSKDAGPIEKENLRRYFDQNVTTAKINTLLIRLAYSSVARTAIVPMQDILDLDHKARMNAPATITNNWEWRMLPKQLTKDKEKWLKEIALIYNRSIDT